MQPWKGLGTTTHYTLLSHYATTVLLQPAFYFLYYATSSSRAVVSKIYLIKRASHDKINGSFLTIRLDNLRLLDSLSQII